LYKAHSELKSLARRANVSSLKQEATAIGLSGVCSILNIFFWDSLMFVLFGLEAFFRYRAPVRVVMAASWLVMYGIVGDGLVIVVNARRLRKKVSVELQAQTGVLTTFAFTRGKASTFDTMPLSNRGAHINLLDWFRQDQAIHAAASVQGVLDDFVMRATRDRKVAFVDTVMDLWGDDGRLAVGTANYFVSHCWADSFCVLCDQVSVFNTRQARPGSIYYWIDIFAINQYKLGDATELSGMASVIAGAEAVVLTLNPWCKPQTLQRVWCLWEIFMAVQSSTEVLAVMPRQEEEHFMRTMQKDSTRIDLMLEAIDAQTADATVQSDRLKIFQEIRSTVGFDGLNTIVRQRIRVAMQGVAVDRLLAEALLTINRLGSQGSWAAPSSPQSGAGVPPSGPADSACGCGKKRSVV